MAWAKINRGLETMRNVLQWHDLPSRNVLKCNGLPTRSGMQCNEVKGGNMREIKFRAWDKTNNEWYMEGNLFNLNYSGSYGDFFFDNDHPHNMRDVELEWEQYTGLKDKNGVEIFEGDIFRYNDLLEVDHPEQKAVIEWNGGKCSLQPREIQTNHKGGRYWTLWDHCLKSEVIGNIHENSELLEEP
jgi:uncharacterized phage protein (TIGR01671 family)